MLITPNIPAWKKHKSKKGVLVRVLTAAQQAAIKAAEKEKERLAEEKRNAKWLKPIPDFEWPKLQRMAWLGGKICDVHTVRRFVTRVNGRDVAAMSMMVYVEFENKMADGIKLVLRRRSDNPRKIEVHW